MNAGDIVKRHQVRVCGQLNAPETLVFVHGFASDQHAWQEVARPFESRYQVVLFDNAGTGASNPARASYLNLRGYADDVIAVVQSVNAAKVTVIGHSAGAMMCLLAAIKRPDLIARLVLLGASPRYLAEAGYPGSFTRDDVDRIYKAVMGDYTGWAESFARQAMENPERQHLAEDFAASLRSMPPDEALDALCALLQTDYRSELPKVTQPTLIVQSESDVFVPAGVARYVQDHISGSRLSIIPARRHYPHISAPHFVARAIQEFLRAAPGAGLQEANLCFVRG